MLELCKLDGFSETPASHRPRGANSGPSCACGLHLGIRVSSSQGDDDDEFSCRRPALEVSRWRNSQFGSGFGSGSFRGLPGVSLRSALRRLQTPFRGGGSLSSDGRCFEFQCQQHSCLARIRRIAGCYLPGRSSARRSRCAESFEVLFDCFACSRMRGSGIYHPRPQRIG